MEQPHATASAGSRGILPAEVEALLEVALVGELTVVDAAGRPITYPLIPLYDGRFVYMTSAALFSRKLRHIKGNPRVALALTDPVGVPAEPFHRATIVGRARVLDEDLHAGWERLLPLWRAKEPVIDSFIKKRFAIPLFFERSIIEVDPVRALFWAGGDTGAPPKVFELAEVG